MVPDDVKYFFTYFMITVAAGKLHRLHCHEPGARICASWKKMACLRGKYMRKYLLTLCAECTHSGPMSPLGKAYQQMNTPSPQIKDISVLRFFPAHGTARRRFIIFQCGFSRRLE